MLLKLSFCLFAVCITAVPFMAVASAQDVRGSDLADKLLKMQQQLERKAEQYSYIEGYNEPNKDIFQEIQSKVSPTIQDAFKNAGITPIKPLPVVADNALLQDQNSRAKLKRYQEAYDELKERRARLVAEAVNRSKNDDITLTQPEKEKLKDLDKRIDYIRGLYRKEAQRQSMKAEEKGGW